VAGEGETYGNAVADHDTKLKTLLELCQGKGILLNKEKLRLRVQNVKYMGYVLTREGLQTEQSKSKQQ
jgi:hypothetical protein